ncbi:MAG: hypothetical protein JKY31_02145 [Rhodobacteraceae bacterium]|nr:hypothetical protein [Paracoccaceae bacterium]
MKHHTYSRLVGIAKIVLPLVALGVLGTVFLVTSDDGFDPGFTFTQSDFDALEAGSFLDNPQINGKTLDGDQFSLSADRIEPKSDNLNQIVATNLTSVFDFISGESAEIISDRAEIHTDIQMLYFWVGAHILTSDGYDGTVNSLTANLRTGEISGETVIVDGPLGHVSADLFQISKVTDDSGENRVLTFEKNVRVILNIEEQAE